MLHKGPPFLNVRISTVTGRKGEAPIILMASKARMGQCRSECDDGMASHPPGYRAANLLWPMS